MRKPKTQRKKNEEPKKEFSESEKEKFSSILNDFVNDLVIVFPEIKEQLNNLDSNECLEHCKNIYPENFFNILYENDDLFASETGKYCLPNIDFSLLMQDDGLSEASKTKIWKYLQLILFSVCNNVDDKKEFGDANFLFEAIDENTLHSKIEETISEMKNVFMSMSEDSDGVSGENMENIFEKAMGEMSGNNLFESMGKMAETMETEFENISGGEQKKFNMNDFDPNSMKDHLSGLMNGKIGLLAKEIAEEASKELGIDAESLTPDSQQKFMKNLFKNPTKLLNIVKKIGTKLEEKFKSGELKESELFEEAQSVMGKMKDMPGMKEMMSTMGLGSGGKFDFKGMAAKMQQNMKTAKTKERMQEKLKKKAEEKAQEEAFKNAKPQDLGEMKKVNDDVFVWNDKNSVTTSKPKKSSKKKGKKKKN